ncbi:MAG: 23S rRNA (guanosine(2251)-2'-O)-methyltransferase RlmB [Spirochaetaceae bacterium]|jgi:23S rRNA (guanosine2251-2'-O)-methyltransferase|nr:23S rRNA (guanosine(2251)-2'-O)-methyltransferase RlmB [Spirochaetaceae bacterium]
MAYLTGFHAIEERIKASAANCVLLAAKPGPRAREILALAVARGVRVLRSGTAELDRISPGHRGLALEADDGGSSALLTLESFLETVDDKKNVLVVMLDEITDPHNFGAILRSCDQFNADIVITRNKRNAGHAAVIAKTSAGASAWVPVTEVANLPRAIEQLKEAGFWVYGADMGGGLIYKTSLPGRLCVIFGGEGAGLSRLLREKCDALIAVPSLGRIDSLNVSVAAGIILYEIIRQRGQPLTPASSKQRP